MVYQQAALQQAREYPATFRGPNVRFEFKYNYTLSCQIKYINSNTLTDSNSCTTQYLLQPNQTNDLYYGFLFGNLQFAGYSPGIFELQINVYVNDPAYNVTSDPGFGFRLYDPDPEFENITPLDTTTKQLSELDNLNYYILGPSQANFISYRRFLNRTLTNAWQNTLGVPPTQYDQEYFMTSSFSSIPMPGNDVKTRYAFISITLQSNELDSITEFKSMTILTLFGTWGGAFTIASGIIATCFGVNLLSPFGVAYQLPCVKSKLKSSLREKNKVYEEHPLALTNNAQLALPRRFQRDAYSKLDDRVQALETFQEELVAYHEQLLVYQQHLDRRQMNMGNFLSEYVVNVEKIINLHSKVTSTCT
ncbi:14178_t:CDS:10 [Ambispora leptoticha]|uniref:14178_t:CDS:1 n=1 Tax=Ambispora leptoticha TaxID=144679 RepID=A0A9N9F1X3_9GLOM|nr:14178_t:CDS:10 [Ambispora leptoticha]